MKVLTILGTRPEIIRLSQLIPKLDQLCDHRIVHTGQNYDDRLNRIFFEELGVRQPNHFLEARGSLGEQMAIIFSKMEKILREEKPDRFLVLGDTNSSLAALIVKRMGIPVYHMEAGNRCFDERVPEEVNRRLIDHASDVLLPYTERSRQNLLREGIPGESIYVTGNPIFEVLRAYDQQIQGSKIFAELGIERKKYFLVTSHRAENVDIPERLRSIVLALERLHDEYSIPVVVSIHPRTKLRMQELGLSSSSNGIRFMEPFGFFDFVALEKNARCVLSDSGTVQEECAILRVPNVTLRDTTERPETIECGSNILSGVNDEMIVNATRLVLDRSCDWCPPREYTVPDVSAVVARIVLGHLHRVR
jgi:UDP-N-acetylglucosamine 2-epimerase (non-hydrolysing)